MSLKRELNHIEEILVDDRTFSIINIVAYSLLLITTSIVGLHSTKYIFKKQTSETINFWALVGLMIIWILLIVAESIKLHKEIV